MEVLPILVWISEKMIPEMSEAEVSLDGLSPRHPTHCTVHLQRVSFSLRVNPNVSPVLVHSEGQTVLLRSTFSV